MSFGGGGLREERSHVGWLVAPDAEPGGAPLALDGFGLRFRGRHAGRGGLRGRGRAAHAARPASLWVSCAVLGSLALHELLFKSVASALVLAVLLTYGATLLALALPRLGAPRDRAAALFLLGFGPGFLLLLVSEVVLAVAMLGAYCKYGGAGECGEAFVERLRELGALPQLLAASPVGGVALAVLLSFANAALLEESVKLVFISMERADAARAEESAWSAEPRHQELARARQRRGCRALLAAAFAFSLGLALSESMLFVCSLAGNGHEALRLSAARMGFAIPIHVLCGLLTALGLCERFYGAGKSLPATLLPSVLLHGAYDLMLLLLPSALGALEAEAARFVLSLAALLLAAQALRAGWPPLLLARDNEDEDDNEEDGEEDGAAVRADLA